MTSGNYDLWQSELLNPTPEERRGDRTTDPELMCGFWRVIGARTKHDTPVAIWVEGGKPILMIGAALGGTDYLVYWWVKSVAVSKEDYDAAIASGYWPDGKPARRMTPEEHLDIIPSTPASEGGNAPEDYAEQIDAKIKVQIANTVQLGVIDSSEKVQAAAAIADDLRALWVMGNNRRLEELRPIDKARNELHDKWILILKPAEIEGRSLVEQGKRFNDREQIRLQDEAAAAAKKQYEKEKKRVEAENVKRRGEAPIGTTVDLLPDPVLEVPQVAPLKVSSKFGRAYTKPKQKRGEITNRAAFIAALDGQVDFAEFLQDKADKLAKAGVALNGMKIIIE